MARDEGYLEAERRIEEVRQAGATELDLSYLQLTEVPEAIASLTQLQTLDLMNNQLTELPEAIASLKLLQTLILSNNLLTDLPDCLGKLTYLRRLSVWGFRKGDRTHLFFTFLFSVNSNSAC